MNTVLGILARLAEARPGRVLVGLLALTIVLGAFAGGAQSDSELTAFAPDSEAAAALDRVQEEFGAGGASLQVLVDAGEGGNVLGPDGLEAARQVREAIEGSGVDLGDRVAPVSSFDQAGDRAGSLLSTDADLEAGTVTAGLVVVDLPIDLTEEEALEASTTLADAIDAQVDVDGIDVDPYNQYVLSSALQTGSEEEMPRLLGLSFLLIIGILLFQFRSVSDVLLGLVGLVVSITWTFGIGVILGPDGLGLVGPFSQISLIVPVLIVGLGIDYAIHLTSRYREEQRHGERPPAAAAMAVRTVGGALVLATTTSVVGFLTNLASPLPPIADFGVFVAVGVISAFVVMAMLVPAARNLLDARRSRRAATSAEAVAEAHRGPGALALLSGRAAVVAERAPKAALGVALAVSLLATVAATQVTTTFSQDDFIPSDSAIGRLIDRIADRFGGELTETTFVVLDGDLATPAAADAMLTVARDLSGTDLVRTTGDAAQVSSPAALVAELAADPDTAGAVADLGYAPEAGFTEAADVAGLYELVRSELPARAVSVLGPDDDAGVLVIASNAGQDRAGELESLLRTAVAPLEEAGLTATITSEPLVLEESLDALTASQTQGIVITLVAALLLLVTYYGIKERKPLLGVITMIPSLAVVSWVLGTMWVLDISFNVLTAMVASIGIGIGVPFGIHVTHRFLEDRRRYDTIDEAIRMTATHTGGAMAGSAFTTAAGFGVLVFASLVPMRQFGMIVAITILYSFVAAILIQPACLKLWGEWRARRGDVAELHEHERRRSGSEVLVGS
ncbi:efflux RND transporter permease subunit [Actinomarinicola tropica]|uniref:efflux RND transporter permease subunit n=1 Tax=Actinomarinicola tropica TaxID=2789776 RepID=UPI0018984A70|nr:MMPL family transporter [Actinomarinicola tropica]